MHPNIKFNILALAAIGALLVVGLALIATGSDDVNALLAVLAIGGTLAGGLSGTMMRLSEPDPDPTVPASALAHIIGKDAGGAAFSDADGWGAWRPNVITLALIGAGIVTILAWVIESDAAIVTVAGGFVGGLVSIAGELVKPPPNPAVPASVVEAALAGSARTAHTAD